MKIPDKWPWIINMTWNFLWKNTSKTVWIVWMWKVLASQEEWAIMKTIDWLNVPIDIAWFIPTIKEKIDYLIEVWKKWWETTINEIIEWWKLFLEPTALYIKNVWNNFELFDDWMMKLLSQNEELWWKIIDTLIAFISVWWIYVFLIPALLKLITYKDCPNLWQRTRVKIMKKFKRIKYNN